MVDYLNTKESLTERVIQFICETRCGTAFDHPGSCEECISDSQRKDYLEYEIRLAKKQGEDYFND